MAGLFVTLSEMEGGPSLAQAWPEVRRIHAASSAALARLWRLPRCFQKLLGAHHLNTGPQSALNIVAERFAFEFAPLIGADPSTPRKPVIMPGKDLSSREELRKACALLKINNRRWIELRGEVQGLLLEAF